MKEQNPCHIARSSSLTSALNPELQFQRSPSDSCFRDWCRLLRDRRWSQKQKYRLLSVLGSPGVIYTYADSHLREIVGGKFRSPSAQVDEADLDTDQKWLAEPDNHLITLCDPRFPELLKQLSDPPIALFASGNLGLLDDPKVAIVGSRRPTPVGAKLVKKLARDLAASGLVISSGMALGIDGMAHQAALDGQGLTIAVMGCGLDIVYPTRNRQLHAQVLEHGLILSEYPLGYKPTRFTFPQRNRIVSGLSYGVVIVEAAERSGTLITARLALDQDRELMVVPGSSLSAQYEGSHQLLREGASLVTSAQDVLFALQQPLQQYISERPSSSTMLLDKPLKSRGDKVNVSDMEIPKAQSLLQHIGAESTPVNQIIAASGLSASEVSSLLLTLELENIIAIDSDGGVVSLS